MPKSNLRQLEKEENQLNAALANVKDFVDNFDAVRDSDMVELRLVKLDEIFDRFCIIRVNIDVLLDETSEEFESAADDDGVDSAKNAPVGGDSVQTYKNFENSYFRLKSALLAKRPRTKYPELKLPSFCGKLQDWITFRDNFKSLIHDNGDLSPIDKFNYLRASLRDEALLQINQVQVSAATYNIAWNILEAKYENHKLIAHEHLKALFSVPVMKSESFDALNTVLMTFKVNLQQLEKLGENTENWNSSIHVVAEAISNSLRQWEIHHSSKNIPHTQNQTSSIPNRPQVANSNAQSQSRQQSVQHSQSHISRMNNTQISPQTPVQTTTPPHTRQPPPTKTPTISHHTATSHNARSQRSTTLLSTALVKLADRFGNTVIARALLDNGSQICMITENLSQRLNFKRSHENLPVKGVGDSMTVSKQSVLARILSRYSSFETKDVKFYVLPRITVNLPQTTIDISSWKLPSDICLADPRFHESSAIDAVLGVSVFYELLLSEQLKLSDSGPILRNTELGWIVAGEITDSPVTTFSAVTASVTTEEIHEQLARFWDLESCRTKSCLSVEESTCESIFEQTTTRDADGKFRVVLPKKQFMMEHLGRSKEITTKRFMGLERRLTANPEMKALYTEFIHEYLLMGHMREVRKEEEEPIHSYYLPHHAVMKPDSTTTKLRVVFDASCATDSGVSLNDTLMSLT
ncbi:uncharacterized protein LOC134204054 [Armigeres subalbatus]|uniref:uncharacterized protein LOC134204054 n=1 Tax=Armigeres subalbatus TaxID=124917 RepID=UPI002ED47AAC